MNQSRQSQQRGGFCGPRSGIAGAPRPHKYTSRMTVNGSPTRTICSWCGNPKKRGRK